MATARAKVMVGAGAAVGPAVLVGMALGTKPGRREPPESVLGGSERHYTWRGHRVFYATRGRGPALLFVHSIHAAGNSYEWRHNFRPLAEHFEVFALDLLGFGKSDRPRLDYSARLYVELAADFVRDVVGPNALLVASSLSGAHAVQVAHEAPGLVGGLVLVGPTGLNRLAGGQGPTFRAVERFFRAPVLGEAAFATLVSRPGIEYYLKTHAYADPRRVTAEVVDYYYRSSHQPGARYAPAAFVGRRLNLDVRAPFARLRQPVTVAWGAETEAMPLAGAEAVRRLNPRARVVVLEGAGALAHEERPEAFNTLVRELAGATAVAHGDPHGRQVVGEGA